jgi:hypothetical protein
MNAEERQLIAGLFDRMRGFALAEKDAEAEALINAQMAGVRDAPYMLVQSVLVQEHALQQAEGRLRELEEQVRALQSDAGQRPAGSGSFLGGLFGGRQGGGAEPARGPTSVPVIGSRATPSVYEGRPGGAPQPGPGQQIPPGPGSGAPQPQAQQPGGGFLRQAMATAAGVAGGMLVAGAIGNLLTGHSAHANPASPTPQTPDGATSASAGETAQPQEAQPQDAAASDTWQEPAYEEAADADGGWFGDDGGDFDI